LVAHPEDANATDEDRRRNAIQLPRLQGAAGGGGRNKVKTKWEELTRKELVLIIDAKKKLPAYASVHLPKTGLVDALRQRVMAFAASNNLTFGDCWPIVDGGDGGDGAGGGGDGGDGAGGDGDGGDGDGDGGDGDGAADVRQDEKEDDDDDDDEEEEDVDGQDRMDVVEPGINEPLGGIGGMEYESENEEEHMDDSHLLDVAEVEEEVVEEVAVGRRSSRARHQRVIHADNDIIPCHCGCRHQYEYYNMVLCRGCGRTSGKYVRKLCVSRTHQCETCRGNN